MGSEMCIRDRSDVDQATITLVGAGGSGASYSTGGNSGGGSSITISGGSVLNMTAGGGQGGGAASSTSGGNGGSAGSQSISGSISGDVVIVQNGAGSGGNGGDGGDGPYWNKNITASGGDTGVVPDGAEGAAGTNLTGKNGTQGRSRPVTNVNTATYNFTYGGGTDQTWTLTPSNSNYGIIGLSWTLAGGGGRNCGNYGGNGCGAAGEGGAGKVFTATYGNPASGTTFKIQPGQWGRTYNGSANAAHSGTGGRAGDGSVSYTHLTLPTTPYV